MSNDCILFRHVKARGIKSLTKGHHQVATGVRKLFPTICKFCIFAQVQYMYLSILGHMFRGNGYDQIWQTVFSSTLPHFYEVQLLMQKLPMGKWEEHGKNPTFSFTLSLFPAVFPCLLRIVSPVVLGVKPSSLTWNGLFSVWFLVIKYQVMNNAAYHAAS